MNKCETPLQQAARHVAEGKARVVRQKALVARFERDGLLEAAAIGHQILADMQGFLVIAQEHLERERRRASAS